MKQFSDLCSHSDYDEKLKTQINIAFGQWFRHSADYERMQGLLYHGDSVCFYALYDKDSLNIYGLGQSISEAVEDASAFFIQCRKEYITQANQPINFGDSDKNTIFYARNVIMADLNTKIWIVSFNVEREFLFR